MLALTLAAIAVICALVILARRRTIGARRADAERRRTAAQEDLLRTARALRARVARDAAGADAPAPTPPLDH